MPTASRRTTAAMASFSFIESSPPLDIRRTHDSRISRVYAFFSDLSLLDSDFHHVSGQGGRGQDHVDSPTTRELGWNQHVNLVEARGRTLCTGVGDRRVDAPDGDAHVGACAANAGSVENQI